MTAEHSPVRISVLHAALADREIPLPGYETGSAAGMDVRANLVPDDRRAGLSIAPGGWALVPSGLSLAIPEGFEVQLRPRSGLALRHGVTLLNSPGTIDSDYRGEIGVILINHGSQDFIVAHGERIAQMVVAPVARAELVAAEVLDHTARGTGGFGSTGR